MRREAIRLSRRHQAVFYGCTVGLFLTGAVWLWLNFWGADALAPQSVRSWMMKLHGGFAMFSLILLGTLLPLHVRRGWRANFNRATGAPLLAVFGLLIVTGYALYYVGSEDARNVASIAHWSIGLAVPVVIGWHVWTGRRARNRPER